MDERELNEIIATSRRRPVAEAALMWTMVWGFVVACSALFFPGFFFDGNGAMLLSRVGLSLVASGIFAAILCWRFARHAQSKVLNAKGKLKALAETVRQA